MQEKVNNQTETQENVASKKTSKLSKSKKTIQSKQGKLPLIQAKQRPVESKQTLYPSSHSPVQRVTQFATNKTSAKTESPINNTGLPNQLKAGIEHLSGYAMDDVNVHYNSSKPAQLKAEAYAQGTNIHLGPGQEHHLPHEAWHVVQQKQGIVKPSVQMKGISINTDQGLEREADLMGAKALQTPSASATPQKTSALSGQSSAPVQGYFGELMELAYEYSIPLTMIVGAVVILGFNWVRNFLANRRQEGGEDLRQQLEEAVEQHREQASGKPSEDLNTEEDEITRNLRASLANHSENEMSLVTSGKEKNKGKERIDEAVEAIGLTENPMMDHESIEEVIEEPMRLDQAIPGDCLYTAVDYVQNGAIGNEGALRQIATDWLVNRPLDHEIFNYSNLDRLVQVVATPREWRGDAGDLSAVVLAHSLGIRLRVVTATRAYVFGNVGAEVTIYFHDNHYTPFPQAVHRGEVEEIIAQPNLPKIISNISPEFYQGLAENIDLPKKENYQAPLDESGLKEEDVPRAGHHLFNNIVKDLLDGLDVTLDALSGYIDAFEDKGAEAMEQWYPVLGFLGRYGQEYEATGRHDDLRVYKHLGRPSGMIDTNAMLHGLMRDFFLQRFPETAQRALMPDGNIEVEQQVITNIWEELVNEAVDEQALYDYINDERTNKGRLKQALAEREHIRKMGRKLIAGIFAMIANFKKAKRTYRNVLGTDMSSASISTYQEPEILRNLASTVTEDERSTPTSSAYGNKGIQVPTDTGGGSAITVSADTIRDYLLGIGWRMNGNTFESPMDHELIDFHLSTWNKSGKTIVEFSVRPKGEDRARSQTFRWFYLFYGAHPNITAGFDGHGGQSNNLLHERGSEHIGEAWRRYLEVSDIDLGAYITAILRELLEELNS
ncbi:MAG TPA: hypothetical protein DCS93_01915 [Microscillaceae bacterium]|nr:hypothetical protein [Microscillaceae bacterium]